MISGLNCITMAIAFRRMIHKPKNKLYETALV
jgi:hypothetical protein